MNFGQDIQFGITGQSLFLDVAEGVPSSVTSCQVYDAAAGDDDDVELATSGSPAVDSTATTLSEDTGLGQADPRLVNLTSTSGIVAGRQYRLSRYGIVEFVEAVEVRTGYITARTPLANAWSPGAAFNATRITQALDSAWVADETNIKQILDPNPTWRVRWVYVVSGVTYVRDSYFDLVRYRSTHSVTPGDIDEIYPDWINTLPTNHQVDQGARLIKSAHNAVALDLYAIGRSDESIANPHVMDELVRYRAIALGEYQKFLAARTDATRYEACLQEYNRRFDQLVRIVNNTNLRAPDGEAIKVAAKPFMRR